MPSKITSTLVVAAALLALYMLAWVCGVAPASREERGFMSTLERSTFSADPRVQAVVAEARNGMYVSRQHFWQAESAFLAVEAEYVRSQSQ